jgi:hypothetical protein
MSGRETKELEIGLLVANTHTQIKTATLLCTLHSEITSFSFGPLGLEILTSNMSG